jgi:hypothetical protein
MEFKNDQTIASKFRTLSTDVFVRRKKECIHGFWIWDCNEGIDACPLGERLKTRFPL